MDSMKRFLSSLVIAMGAMLAVGGLIGTPVVLDRLPADWVLPASDEADAHYFRIATDDSPRSDLLPYTLLIGGLMLLVSGVRYRRRLGATKA
jgi:hypothetical protein